MDQRNCVKFCLKNERMSRTQVQLFYNRFKEGREDFNEVACVGRSSTSKTDESIEGVKKMILNNRRITIRKVADNVGISFVSCQVMKIFPKQRPMEIAQDDA